MGQRLNVEIVNGDVVLANCYYHWSAYTSSALHITKQIIDAYRPLVKSPIDVRLAVMLLEDTGGGVNEGEMANIRLEPERFGDIVFGEAVDRNQGLISVTDHGINETRYWEESRVTIDLSKKRVRFDVLWVDDPDNYKEEYIGDDEEWNFMSFDEIKFDFSKISFNIINEVISFVETHADGARRNNDFIHWIE